MAATSALGADLYLQQGRIGRESGRRYYSPSPALAGKPSLPENLEWPTWNKSAHIQDEIDGLERIFECAQMKAGDSSEELRKNYQDKIAEMRKEMLAGERPLAFRAVVSA